MITKSPEWCRPVLGEFLNPASLFTDSLSQGHPVAAAARHLTNGSVAGGRPLHLEADQAPGGGTDGGGDRENEGCTQRKTVLSVQQGRRRIMGLWLHPRLETHRSVWAAD